MLSGTAPAAARPVTGACSEDVPTATVAVCEAACAAGAGSACAVAADRYYGGDRVREDDAASLRDALRACELDVWRGCLTASAIYAGNHDGSRHELADPKQVEPYERRTVLLYERDCTAGSGEACAAIAYWLAQPVGFAQYDWLPRDPARANRLAARARALEVASCDAGHGRVCAAMALDHDTGMGLATQPDAAKALALYTRACGLDFAPACNDAASRIAFEDPRRAELLRRGCDLGWGWSCSALGILTGGDLGIAISERGCELDNTTACERVAGELDDRGRHAEARGMRQHACELGDTDGCASGGSAAP